MEYLPTFAINLGHSWIGKYSSPMEHLGILSTVLDSLTVAVSCRDYLFLFRVSRIFLGQNTCSFA